MLKDGLFKEMKKRAYYEKPSVKRKRKQAEARKKQRKAMKRAEGDDSPVSVPRGHAPLLPPRQVTEPSESLASPRLWLAFATMLLVSGFNNTFPVFFPPLLEEFGGSRAATGSTASLLWLGA